MDYLQMLISPESGIFLDDFVIKELVQTLLPKWISIIEIQYAQLPSWTELIQKWMKSNSLTVGE